jgi:hypothetical protein
MSPRRSQPPQEHLPDLGTIARQFYRGIQWANQFGWKSATVDGVTWSCRDETSAEALLAKARRRIKELEAKLAEVTA